MLTGYRSRSHPARLDNSLNASAVASSKMFQCPGSDCPLGSSGFSRGDLVSLSSATSGGPPANSAFTLSTDMTSSSSVRRLSSTQSARRIGSCDGFLAGGGGVNIALLRVYSVAVRHVIRQLPNALHALADLSIV